MSVDAPSTPDVDGVDDAVESAAHDHAEHADHDHPSDNRYIVIALILAVITAAEVAASYVDLGPAFIPLLLFMMAIKFFIVVSFFMHLRFDNRIFSFMFYTGLVLALGVYAATLLTFEFFNG